MAVRRISAAQHAYRASVHSADLSNLFEDPANSYNYFITKGNQKTLILSNATKQQIETIILHIPNNTNIERIHIFNSKSNEQVLIKLMETIKQVYLPNLIAIDLHNNNLTSDIILCAFKPPVSFSCLDLSFNNITAIPQFPPVYSAPPLTLYLDNNPAIQYVERIFEQLPCLSYCSLAGNKLENEDILKLSQTVNSTKHAISGLDLSHNNISDAGCVALCDHILLQEFSSLSHLSLQANSFEAKGRIKLIQMLEITPSVVEFKPEFIYQGKFRSKELFWTLQIKFGKLA